MKLFKILTNLSLMFLLFCSCDMMKKFEKRAVEINRFEKVSYFLAKENRELKAKISELKYQIKEFESKNNFLALQLKRKAKRSIASIPPVNPDNDLVKFEVYKWSPGQILAMAEREFGNQNYEKSAQFFQTYIRHFPGHKNNDDQTLFQAGIAAYESKMHDNWALTNLNYLVNTYPKSRFYRGAKLWLSLVHLRKGNNKKFFQTVEEFRKRYRNTPEWKILSVHYEKISQKYKN